MAFVLAVPLKPRHGKVESKIQTNPVPAATDLSQLLQDILTSRVYDVARETPLDAAPRLSRRLGHDVLFKREDLQPVFSFKLRGAYNKIAHLTEVERARGVIAASAGNHAQGVAYSARELRLRATIVMPQTTPQIKVAAVKALGAEVVLFGDNYSEAQVHCDTLVQQTGMSFVHPFDDPLVIAGQGTVGAEIMWHSQEQLSAVFVPVGGGGLIAGIAGYIKALRPDIRIIGVEPYEADAMYQSLKARRRVRLDHVGIFADGVAVREVGAQTFDIALKTVDEVIRVSNDEMCAAIKDIFDDTRSIMEPAGALAVAGMKSWAAREGTRPGQTIAAILSGANMNFDRLRFVAERAELGEARETLLAISVARASRFVPRVLRRAGPARRHRVQLPAEQPGPGAHLRGRGHPIAPGRRGAGGAARGGRLPDHGPHRQRDGQAPRAPYGRRSCARPSATSGCAGSSSRNVRAHSRNSSKSWAAAGTSASSTTAITARTSAACWPASRWRTRTCRRSTRSWTSWVTPTRRKTPTRRTVLPRGDVPAPQGLSAGCWNTFGVPGVAVAPAVACP